MALAVSASNSFAVADKVSNTLLGLAFLKLAMASMTRVSVLAVIRSKAKALADQKETHNAS